MGSGNRSPGCCRSTLIGREFLVVDDRDPVIRNLQQRYRGLRPVCFPSPYEAAAWGVLSHRIRTVQAAQLKRRIALAFGEPFSVGGTPLHAFPAPTQLAALTSFPGLNATKVARLGEVARAAHDGVLLGGRLRASSPEVALERLLALPGVGPFTAELILIRGAGAPDVLPTAESRLRIAVERAYGPGTQLEDVAPSWRPFRSWCAVLLRLWLESETHDIARGRSAAGCGIAIPQAASRSHSTAVSARAPKGR
jgi:DNA-3-methyladenine glycosylase II